MTITLTREEAQQVLDAFLGMGQRAADAMDGDAFHECHIAVSRLRARLSAPEPEPVAWMNESDMGRTDWKVWAHGKPTATIPLYTTPPQRDDIYEEGCTPADFRVLREANARMAQELFELKQNRPEPAAWTTDIEFDDDTEIIPTKIKGKIGTAEMDIPLYAVPHRDEPNYRDVVIKNDLWRIEFLPDHAASVVLVRANYEPKPVPCPVAWKDAAIRLGEELSSVGPDGYYDMTPQQWLDWALNQQPRGKNSLPEPPCKTGSQCIGGKCPQCVVSEPEPESKVRFWPEMWNVRYNRPPYRSDKPIDCHLVLMREWQGLTDEEIMDLCAAQWASHPIDVARIIEAKLKEKNASDL